MKKILAALVVSLASMSVFAAPAQKGGVLDRAATDAMVANQPTTDGCGLGWQVTQKKTLMGTSTRGTTNAFVPPTFGMTSGTIGCDQHSFAKKDQAAATFAIANFENLRIEMAEGRGENLAAFAETMGCSDAAAFGSLVKSNYRSIMSGASESPAVMFRNVKALNSCGA